MKALIFSILVLFSASFAMAENMDSQQSQEMDWAAQWDADDQFDWDAPDDFDDEAEVEENADNGFDNDGPKQSQVLDLAAES